jgi:hypothetical protein
MSHHVGMSNEHLAKQLANVRANRARHARAAKRYPESGAARQVEASNALIVELERQLAEGCRGHR